MLHIVNWVTVEVVRLSACGCPLVIVIRSFEGPRLMRVEIDASRCQGHALCAMTAPHLFDIRESDGSGLVAYSGALRGADEVQAKRAAAGCPERAIVLLEG